MSDRGYTLAVWSDAHMSWASIAVSPRRDVIEGLGDRLAAFLSVPVELVETASMDDDAVERALSALAFPDEGFDAHAPGSPESD